MMIWFLVVLWLAIKASTACCDDRLDRPSATKLQKLDRFYGLLAAARIAEELGLDPLETALGRPQVRRRRELSAQNSLNSIRSECEREWADDLDVVHVWSHGKLAEAQRHEENEICDQFAISFALKSANGRKLRATELWLPALHQHNFSTSELKLYAGEKIEIYHNPVVKYQHEKSDNHLYAIIRIQPEIECCSDGQLSVEFSPKFTDCHLAKRYLHLWTNSGPFTHFILTEPPKRVEIHVDRRKRSIQQQNVQLPIRKCEEMWTRGAIDQLDSQPFVSSSFAPCCQREITVNFTELGWENWIKSPAVFTTSYCIGRCTNFGGFHSLAHGIYAQIMDALPEIEALGKKPCCTPVRFSPLLVTVEQGDELVTQRLNDAIVDQCGCL